MLNLSSFIIEASKEEVLVGEEEMTLALDNLSKLVNGKMIDQYILAEIKPSKFNICIGLLI